MKRFVALALLSILVIAGVAPAQQSRSAAALLQDFLEALNSGEFSAVAEFYETGVTDEFRARRTTEQDRTFYERIQNDLGKLEVEEMRRLSGSKAVVTLSAEKMDMPVVFAFDLAGGKIDGFSVSVGGGGRRESSVQLPEGVNDHELTASLDRQLHERVQSDKFSGVVLLARDGEPFFHRGYGMAERASGRSVTPATRFDVASITKLMTKIAIAQLAQAGKLELTDTVFEHLPGYPDADVAKQVTIQQLVDHSSGLGDIFNNRWAVADKSLFIRPQDFFPLFAGEPLQFEPGARRAYSNAGYITLGAIVAAVSGMPYFEYVEEKVFTAAGMSQSGFPVKDGSDPLIAVGYTRGGPTGGRTDATGPLQSNLGMLPIRGCPAGSSTHSAEDLLRLDRALRGGTLLDAEWTAWVFGAAVAEEGAGYGLGVAGGGPGVSAGWESNGAVTSIVLANLDPPAGEGLATELFRALRDTAAPASGPVD